MIDRILNKLGISLNEMQQEAFQSIAHGNKDVVVLSPTGSGKTLAYLLPLSSWWMRAMMSRRQSWLLPAVSWLCSRLPY